MPPAEAAFLRLQPRDPAGDFSAGGSETGVTPHDAAIVVVVLLGNMFSMLLAGLAWCQFLIVFRLLFPSRADPEARERHERLRLTLKWKLITGVVALLFVISVTDVIIKIYDMAIYEYRVLLHGHNSIVHFPRIAIAVSILEGIVALIVQAVYLVRLYFVWPGKRGLLFYGGIVFFLAMSGAQTGASIWTGYLAEGLDLAITDWGVMTPQVTVWWACASVNDIGLVAAFCYSLSRLRTGFRRTDSEVMAWIVFTLETGLLSTICQVASLVLFLVGHARALEILFVMPMIDVYTNSVLLLFRTMLTGGPLGDPLNREITNSILSPSQISSGSKGSGPRPRKSRSDRDKVVIATLPTRNTSYELSDRTMSPQAWAESVDKLTARDDPERMESIQSCIP